MNAEFSKKLEGKVAIVTGGSSGIGETTVRFFAKHGAKVVIADIQDDLGLALCNDLSTISKDIIYVHCDVSKESDVSNVVDTAVSKFGKLDIMFSNAGIGSPHASIVDFDENIYKRVFDVNVLGSFLTAKHAARVMIGAKSGVILFTSSSATECAALTPLTYTVTKHAIVGLTKNLGVELGEHGIRVNCISPFAIATPMLTSGSGLEPAMLDDIMRGASVLKGESPTSEDVAEAALYLASSDSKFVSGINLVVDGGYSTTNQAYQRLFRETFQALQK